MHRGDCSFCTKLVRRDLFEEEGFPVGVLNEDFHLLVKLLTRRGYTLQSVQPVDMFPFTPHVEAVALLTRKA